MLYQMCCYWRLGSCIGMCHCALGWCGNMEYGIWDMDFKLDFVITSVRRSVVFLLSLLEEITEGLSWYPGILKILELFKSSCWSENILTIWLERDGNFRMKLGLSNEEKSRLLWFWLFDNQIMYSIRVDRFRLQKRKNVKGAFLG